MSDITWGLPLQADVATHRFPMVGEPALPARAAAAEILAAYLRRLEWYSASSPDSSAVSTVKRWRLNEVLTAWPTPGHKLDYPACSLDELVIPLVGYDMAPQPLEETLHCYGRDTVLWKTDEETISFQADFWLNTEADREAIEAGLPRIFSPTEVRSGVLLSGHPRYYERPLRVTLQDFERVDTSDEAYTRERRLRAILRAEIDVVHLREVRGLVIRSNFQTE